VTFFSTQQALITAQGDGAALATSTTATSILPAQAKFTLPANTLAYAGQQLRIRAAGRVSNIVTTPGTLTFSLRFGATTVGTSGAMVLNTTAKTNVTWLLDWAFTMRAVGGSATLMHIGQWTSESVVGSASGVANTQMIPTSAPAVGTAFDSTASQQADLFAAWSISNAGNSVQLHTYALELIN
jgi:hypothetical protein